MLKKLLIAFALFASCALLLTACGGTDSNSNSNSSNANTANKATTSDSPATTSSPATTASSADDKIGVAECDDYLAKYEACVSGKVPESARAQYKASLAQMRKSWRDLAANPQTKAGLVQACKMASEQSKTQFQMYGCDF